jgi:hypothetical protein
MNMRPRCPQAPRGAAEGKLTLHLTLSLGDHPTIILSVARLLVLVLDELASDHVPVHGVELGIDGELPERQQ